MAKEWFRCYCDMIPFNNLLKIMVVHPIITVGFYVNAFSRTKRAPKILPPLTIVEGIVLYFNLYFLVTRGEFVQTL